MDELDAEYAQEPALVNNLSIVNVALNATAAALTSVYIGVEGVAAPAQAAPLTGVSVHKPSPTPYRSPLRFLQTLHWQNRSPLP